VADEPVKPEAPAAVATEPGLRRLPSWLKSTLPGRGEYAGTRTLLRTQRLATVCEDAHCPNLGHCWERGTATIMILGELCTRRCGFCAVGPGKPEGIVDWDEPRRVGEAVAAMGLRHAVITSVTRDDLEHGLRDGDRRDPSALADRDRSADPGLSRTCGGPPAGDRGAARGDQPQPRDGRAPASNGAPECALRPLAGIAAAREAERHRDQDQVGDHARPGRDHAEVEQTLADLRAHDCELLTIGQYLRPTPGHLPVAEYVHPDKFAFWKARADALGFEKTASGPLVRSSFHADELAGTVRGVESSKSG
jgi:lipoic acid synthetase